MEKQVKPKDQKSFLVRHREPFWAYENGQRAGTCHFNYLNKNGRRSLRLHIQIKQRGHWDQTVQTISVLIPIPTIWRILQLIIKDGPIEYQKKVTFEKMRFVKRAPATKQKR